MALVRATVSRWTRGPTGIGCRAVGVGERGGIGGAGVGIVGAARARWNTTCGTGVRRSAEHGSTVRRPDGGEIGRRWRGVCKVGDVPRHIRGAGIIEGRRDRTADRPDTVRRNIAGAQKRHSVDFGLSDFAGRAGHGDRGRLDLRRRADRIGCRRRNGSERHRRRPIDPDLLRSGILVRNENIGCRSGDHAQHHRGDHRSRRCQCCLHIARPASRWPSMPQAVPAGQPFDCRVAPVPPP